MNFRAVHRKIADDLSSDMSMDSSMEDASLPHRRDTYQPTPSTDGQDPATRGGPAPFNGTAPAGRPVASDPLVPTPKSHQPGRDPVPYLGPGPDVDVTTLHGASLGLRAAIYHRNLTRMR